MKIRSRFIEMIEGKKFHFHQVEFTCLECEDTGYVSIFWPRVIAQAIQDPDSVKWWKTCAALCYCEKGEVILEGWPPADKRKPPVIFGSAWWHVNAKDPDAKAKAATLVNPEPTLF